MTRLITRFRSRLANLQGFNLTLQVDQTLLSPGAWVEPYGKLTYRGVGVPQAEVRIYVDEKATGAAQTDLSGNYKSTPIGFPAPGQYRLIARVILAPRLIGYALVESSEVTVTVGYTLTIKATSGGTTDPAPGTYPYQVGDVTVTARPQSGYVLSYWLLDGVNVGKTDSYTVTMDADHSIEAVFATTGEAPPAPPGMYKLTINVETGLGTTSPAPGAYNYAAGSQVKVTALPESGWVLWFWRIDGKYAGTGNPITVGMDADHVLRVNFAHPVPVTIVNTMSTTASIGVFKAGTYYDYDVPPGQTDTRNIYVDSVLTPYGAQFAENPTPPPTQSTWTVTGPVTLHVEPVPK